MNFSYTSDRFSLIYRSILILAVVMAFSNCSKLVALDVISYGSANQFLFLDMGDKPRNRGRLNAGQFTGNIGWTSTRRRRLSINRNASVTGDVYRPTGSTLRLRGTLIGTDRNDEDMSGYVADVLAARDGIEALTADQTLGSIQGGTLNRLGHVTVIDATEIDISNATLTINGLSDDVFYIRVSDRINFSSSDLVVTGTDASRVFFYYSGGNLVNFNGGSLAGNFLTPNSAVRFSSLDAFSGTVISAGGFRVSGNANTEFTYVQPVPEPNSIAVLLIGAAATLLGFRRKRRPRVSSGFDSSGEGTIKTRMRKF